MGVQLRASTEALRRAAEALLGANERLPEQFDRVLADMARKLADEASAAVMLEPTHGAKHTGLRARIAAGVSVASGPGFADIKTSMAKNDERYLPRGMDFRASGGKGWRHPLFGNKKKWYANLGELSWFLDTMDNADEDIGERLQEVLEEMARQIGAESES